MTIYFVTNYNDVCTSRNYDRTIERDSIQCFSYSSVMYPAYEPLSFVKIYIHLDGLYNEEEINNIVKRNRLIWRDYTGGDFYLAMSNKSELYDDENIRLLDKYKVKCVGGVNVTNEVLEEFVYDIEHRDGWLLCMNTH